MATEGILGFIANDTEEAQLGEDVGYGGIQLADDIPKDQYAVKTFNKLRGTVLPRAEETGRIVGTHNVYGRVQAGQSFSKNGTTGFLPKALISNMESTAKRLSMIDAGQAREAKATEPGELVVRSPKTGAIVAIEPPTATTEELEIELKEAEAMGTPEDKFDPSEVLAFETEESDDEESLFEPPVTDVDALVNQLGVMRDRPEADVETSTQQLKTRSAEPETMPISIEGSFGKVTVKCLNVYREGPLVIISYPLMGDLDYTPPSGLALRLAGTYQVIFTGIEFPMEDLGVKLQIFVLDEQNDTPKGD